MEYSQTVDDQVYTVKLKGKFTFSDNQNFRKIIVAAQDSSAQTLHIDISQIDFIDSAALGMLLVAKEEMEKHKKQLYISQPEGQVKKMFDVSNFSQIFDIK